MSDDRGGRAFDTVRVEAHDDDDAIGEARSRCDDPVGMILTAAILVAMNGTVVWSLRRPGPGTATQEGDRPLIG